jgi:hypothetical protein
MSVPFEARHCKVRDVLALSNVTESPGLVHRPAALSEHLDSAKCSEARLQKVQGGCPNETLML